MKLLAIDTATSACSVALLAGDRIVAERSAGMQRGHAEALMPMVAEVLAASLSACPRGFADLELVAVTAGPGAFTGVRIGLAAAGLVIIAATLLTFGRLSDRIGRRRIWIVGLIVFFWFIAAAIVALREAFEFDTGRAIGTGLVALVVILIVDIVLSIFFGIGSALFGGLLSVLRGGF